LYASLERSRAWGDVGEMWGDAGEIQGDMGRSLERWRALVLGPPFLPGRYKGDIREI